MLTGSELQAAITAVLVGAVCVGFLLHWLWNHLTRARSSEGARLAEMAERLHEADMAREEAEAARGRAEMLLAQREVDMTERLAVMQARVDGAAGEREATLAAELSEARIDLETMRDGLGLARRRIADLEEEIAALRGEGT